MVAVVYSMAAWAERTSAASLAAEVLAVGTAVSAASWRGIGAEVRLRAVLLLSPAHVRAPRVRRIKLAAATGVDHAVASL